MQVGQSFGISIGWPGDFSQSFRESIGWPGDVEISPLPDSRGLHNFPSVDVLALLLSYLQPKVDIRLSLTVFTIGFLVPLAMSRTARCDFYDHTWYLSTSLLSTGGNKIPGKSGRTATITWLFLFLFGWRVLRASLLTLERWTLTAYSLADWNWRSCFLPFFCWLHDSLDAATGARGLRRCGPVHLRCRGRRRPVVPWRDVEGCDGGGHRHLRWWRRLLHGLHAQWVACLRSLFGDDDEV